MFKVCSNRLSCCRLYRGQEALIFSEHIKIYTKDHCEVSCSSEPQGGMSRNNFSSSQRFHYRLNLHLRLGAVTPAFAISTLKAPSAHEWTFVSASPAALQGHECGGWLAGGVSLSVEIISIFFPIPLPGIQGKASALFACPFMILFVALKHWAHVLDRLLAQHSPCFSPSRGCQTTEAALSTVWFHCTWNEARMQLRGCEKGKQAWQKEGIHCGSCHCSFLLCITIQKKKKQHTKTRPGVISCTSGMNSGRGSGSSSYAHSVPSEKQLLVKN